MAKKSNEHVLTFDLNQCLPITRPTHFATYREWLIQTWKPVLPGRQVLAQTSRLQPDDSIF